MMDKIKAFYEAEARRAQLAGISDLDAAELVQGLTALVCSPLADVSFDWAMGLCDIFNSCREYMGDDVCYTCKCRSTLSMRVSCLFDDWHSRTGMQAFGKLSGLFLSRALSCINA